MIAPTHTSDIRSKRLLLFGVTRLSDVVAKGNVWYVRGYECFFDHVDVVYLLGDNSTNVAGKTRLVSLGGSNGIVDFILSPWRLYQFSRKSLPDIYLTADQWFLWWTTILVRGLLGARIVLMPVSMPDQLYNDHGKTVTGLPLWLDRALRWASYKACSCVFSGKAFGDYVSWLSGDRWAAHKLIVGNGLIEALPSADFMAAADGVFWKRSSSEKFRGIYVGRLAKEKLVDHLIGVMAKLSDRFNLTIVGDGPHRAELEALVQRLGVGDRVHFAGSVPNNQLPALLCRHDAFLSSLTGTSLREAALVGLPIVAYNRDWLRGLFIHRETALLIDDGDIDGFAAALRELAGSEVLSINLSNNVRSFANELWSVDKGRESLAVLFDNCRSPRS